MIFLRRNNTEDPWFHVHEDYIEKGEIVKLDTIVNEPGRSAHYPPEIYVTRSKDKKDKYIYLASLCCFDYMGSSK